MSKRVLILSASSGAGHTRAAQALERAFRERTDVLEVRHEDALQYTSPAFRSFYSKAYIDMVNRAPGVLGWLYDYADKPWKDESRRLMIDRLNAIPLINALRRYRPDTVVCTHFLPSEIMSWLICRRAIQAKHAVVVTDFDVHAMWLCRHVSRYFVAMDETKVHLEQLGFNPDRISVSGIPVDPAFALNKDKTEMRLKLGVQADRPTILLSAGGFGVGPIEHIVKSVMAIKHPAQILAMCGRNDELRIRLNELNERTESNVLVKAVGYTTEMDEYMAASDIVLGKPGGLTTSEALTKGLVFAIVNPIPGQEERNADHLLEEGAAIRCNNLPTLAYKIDKLLSNPTKLQEMKENALRLSKPLAAANIAESMMTERMPDPRFVALQNSKHSCDSVPERVMRATRKTARKIGNKPIRIKLLERRDAK